MVLAAGDKIEILPQANAAVAVATVAALADGALQGVGGTVVTSVVHGLAVGDRVTLDVDQANDDGVYEVLKINSTTSFTVQADAIFIAQNSAGGTVRKSWVNDLSENGGAATLTKTMNAVNDADLAKPVLSVKLTCTQGTDAILSNGTTVKATGHAAYGPQGVAGNTYKMYVVNSRGISLPTVVVDATAATITITADLAYTSIADVQASYANTGGIAWSFAFAASPATSATSIGTASATTAAAPITSAGGSTGDVVGLQSCTAKVTSNEYLQAMAADATTAVAAINGVATAFADGTSNALADGWKTITFTGGTLSAWTLPIADGTTTITLNAGPTDAAGNTVTNLQLVD
jgi:hypothetical protein